MTEQVDLELPEPLGDRQRLWQALDSLEHQTELLRAAKAIDEYRAQAFAMLTSPAARKVFDLSQESPDLVDRYGRTRFGQSCLLGRRLVEHGVPFVQINWSDHVEAEEDSGDGGWDHHYRNFQIMQDRQAPWLDQALVALLTDLRDRGLLDQTLVVVLGEFGRRARPLRRRQALGCPVSRLDAAGGVRFGTRDHRA